jgi:mRNA-degrading endonuclease RelE of RelBE toxin-antitoxin system
VEFLIHIHKCIKDFLDCSLDEGDYILGSLAGRCRGLWKLRIGVLRIAYEVRLTERVVYVWRAGLQESIYGELC